MKIMLYFIAVVLIGCFAVSNADSQGSITYISNLGNTSTGSEPVGSDSWLAGGFITGGNQDGYMLNSVELAMTGSSGNANDFTVMLYSSVSGGATLPGVSLGTLTGTMDPATAGTYTYTASSDLALSPNSDYFIVLKSGTEVANGSFNWSITTTTTDSYNSYHWAGPTALLGSSDGSTWNGIAQTYSMFSLTAMPIPEPSTLSLLALGGAFLALRRRTRVSRS